jgi:hypothetical protein
MPLDAVLHFLRLQLPMCQVLGPWEEQVARVVVGDAAAAAAAVDAVDDDAHVVVAYWDRDREVDFHIPPVVDPSWMDVAAAAASLESWGDDGGVVAWTLVPPLE